jgi:hypothetical protein
VCHSDIDLASNPISDYPVLVIQLNFFRGCWDVAWIGSALATAIEWFNVEVRVGLFGESHEPLEYNGCDLIAALEFRNRKAKVDGSNRMVDFGWHWEWKLYEKLWHRLLQEGGSKGSLLCT